MYCEICGKKCGYPPRCHTCYNKYGASFYKINLPPNLKEKTCVLCGRPSGISNECYSCYVALRLYEKQPTEIKPLVELEETPSIEPEETPSVEPEETPSVELEEAPSVELEEAPSVELEEAPSIELEEAPSIEPEKTPLIKVVELEKESLFKSGEVPSKKAPLIDKFEHKEDDENFEDKENDEAPEQVSDYKKALKEKTSTRNVVRGTTKYCKNCGKPSGKYPYCRICHEHFIHAPFISENGYLMVYSPEHSSRKDGYAYEHRIIAEELLNRKLKKNEVVHHINGNKLDNRKENLSVMDRKDHEALHDLHF